MALVLWVWFQEDERSTNRRASLLLGLSASLIAVLLARILSFTVPFRERPLRNPDLHFVLPYQSIQMLSLGGTLSPATTPRFGLVWQLAFFWSLVAREFWLSAT